MKKGIYIIFNFKSFLIFAALVLVTATSVFLLNFHSVSLVSKKFDVGTDSATVIIDAGHGGEDGGTQSKSGVLEKDINLSISLKIKAILDSFGIDNVLIRDTDSLIYDNPDATMRQRKVSDIHNRLDIVENTDNALLLSIHQNYFEQSKYNGAQVFYSPNNPKSAEIAQSIQNSIVKNIQKDNNRKIKKSGKEIYLLYNTSAPAVMVECGFLSNEGEAKMLTDEEYQIKIALAVCEGILDFI